MEVTVSMGILEADKGGRYLDFDLVAFYPGKGNSAGFEGNNHWKEVYDDVSVMPVAHLFERAFNLDGMVVFKKPDQLSPRLLDAFKNNTLMNAIVYVHMKNNGQKSVQVGRYEFTFQVNRIVPNQIDKEGRKWEAMEIFIVDETEKIMGLDE